MKTKESRVRVSHGHMNARKVNIASIRGDQNATTKRHRSKCGPLRRDHSTPARLAARRHLGFDPLCAARLAGPNPTDRAKRGSKRHLICDGRGVPLAVRLTGANRHDSKEALALVDAIPPLQGERGRPRCRPECVLGDRAYDAEAIRQGLRVRHILPLLADFMARVWSPLREEFLRSKRKRQ